MSDKNKILLSAAAATLAVSLILPTTITTATAAPGASVSTDAEPVSSSSTALTPLREAVAEYGADMKWDQKTHTITITKDSTVIVLTVGKSHALVNGKQITLEHPVTVVSGHTLVDANFMNEQFHNAQQSADPADLFIQRLEAGKGTEAAQYVSSSSAHALPQSLLNVLWSNYETYYGKMKLSGAKTEKVNAVHRNVTYSIETGTVPLEITVRLNLSGQVDDLNLTTVTDDSGYKQPAYDKADSYTEQEITIGEGTLALPGTLTIPKGEGPFPAVVLVQGSGPHDRDSSIGGTKLFRDLAAGLASQGIAVLRYDKVTYEHSFRVSADPKLTMKRETVDDALSAVQLLKADKNIDASRIFVAGHSQGGYAMPLLISEDSSKSVAGAVIISGPSGKFADVLAEQQKELVQRVKQLGIDATPYEQQAAQYIAIADLVNDPQYTVDHMPEQFPIQPAYWWFEQKNYNPAEAAKGQNVPMLVLQGENDWQVTMKQFEGWKTALKARKNVKFKSYPHVNHLLTEYKNLSIGTEYAKPSNVSQDIVNDIATWIKDTK
ncbi:alpha/beta hydrolase family protein [Paenibacillus aceti]|uniref:Hydrolase n=1 Tax=Paenibacillus aceti TaxID=1820010 RepID=A0ABQ1VW19_9BACL|nr:stalk domain-containing protein [Paenibacillus aceti]GGF99763.1 hypothetical protein GCM10010913_21940 [Paenibacillus aceti]